jgi:anaerobic magnesium-protoporphyrin IX monomethyl ester cyclase
MVLTNQRTQMRRFIGSSVETVRVCFVPTPMITQHVPLAGRDVFWKNFDNRYYAVHRKQSGGITHIPSADSRVWELPHWVPWLGGVLEVHGYKHVVCTDLVPAIDQISDHSRDLYEALTDLDSNVFLLSPMTINLHVAYKQAEIIKTLYPESIVIFGGVVASPLHEEVACNKHVDFVITGRGEYALPALLLGLRTGNMTTCGNLTYGTDSSNVVISPLTYPNIPPSQLPFPNVGLLPSTLGPYLRYIRLNYGIGCPFKCSFCTIQTIGRKTEYFPIQRVLDEFDAYRAVYGNHHSIYFGDETFTIDKKKSLDLCTALEERGNVIFDVQTRLTSMHSPELLRALQRAGCRLLEVGLEALNQKGQKQHKQSTNLSKLRSTLTMAKDAGLPVASYMVNALPGQTPDDMNRSVDALCELIDEGLLYLTYFSNVVPYPGSQLYATPDKFGMKILHHDYSLYNEEGAPVFDTLTATSQQSHECFQTGVLKISQAMGRDVDIAGFSP